MNKSKGAIISLCLAVLALIIAIISFIITGLQTSSSVLLMIGMVLIMAANIASFIRDKKQ